jgi:hypothetical protein
MKGVLNHSRNRIKEIRRNQPNRQSGETFRIGTSSAEQLTAARYQLTRGSRVGCYLKITKVSRCFISFVLSCWKREKQLKKPGKQLKKPINWF